MKKKNFYTHEFKIECVKKSMQSDKKLKEIAEELNVPYNLLLQWRCQYMKDLNNENNCEVENHKQFSIKKTSSGFKIKKIEKKPAIRKVSHVESNKGFKIVKIENETPLKESKLEKVDHIKNENKKEKPKKIKKIRKKRIQKRVLALILLSFLFVMVIITSCAKTPEEKQLAKTGKERLKIKLEGVVKPYRTAKIIAPATGKISKIFFHNGDWVNKGDIIYEISFPRLKAQIIKVQNQIKNIDDAIARKKRLYNADIVRKGELIRIAKSQLERIAGLYAQGFSTKREVELAEEKYYRLLDERQSTKTQYKSELINLENNRENLIAQLKTLKENAKNTAVKSPISGYLTSLDLIVGTEVNKGSTVGLVLNLNKVIVRAGIAAGLYKYIHKNDIVHIDFITTPPYSTKAKISRIIPIVDPKIGRMIAEIDLDNHNFLLQDGTKALITIYPTKEAQEELNKYFYKRKGSSVVEIRTNIK